jgi:hypothetical protein
MVGFYHAPNNLPTPSPQRMENQPYHAQAAISDIACPVLDGVARPPQVSL